MTKASEDALKILGCAYYESHSSLRADFEVTQPSKFLISIEDLCSSIEHNDWKLLMFSHEESGSSFLITAPSEDHNAQSMASKFVATLLPLLKRKPWDGLGMVRSRTARILWEQWLERRDANLN